MTSNTNTSYLIKGDISGIQEFIFSVKSDGAAKSLKARSFFLTAATKITIELLKQRLDAIDLIYDGGGNFGLVAEVADVSILNTLQAEINEALSKDDLVLVIGFVPYEGNYAAATKLLDNQQLPRRKMQAYQSIHQLWMPAKRPNPEKNIDKWKLLTKTISKATDFDFFFNVNKPLINHEGYTLLKTHYRLVLKTDTGDLVGKIDNKLPLISNALLNHLHYSDIIKEVKQEEIEGYKYRMIADPEQYPLSDKPKPAKEDDILEFSVLAGFAKARTGTRKLGVLKMDVDDLGKFFETMEDLTEASQQSALMKQFFSEELYQLWQGKFADTAYYRDNIYIVFAGGDDLMMVGAWDAVFEFTKVVRNAFVEFSKTKMKQPLSISGGLLLLDPKYPIIRFAQLAEDALEEAKHAGKDRISIFGQVLTWCEFERMYRVKNQLYQLITKAKRPESRQLLERIKQSGVEFLEVQEQVVASGRVRVPRVWRLDYFLRNIQKTNKEEVEKLFNEYSRALLDAAISGKSISPAVFPVAARWAEFLTRNKTN